MWVLIRQGHTGFVPECGSGLPAAGRSAELPVKIRTGLISSTQAEAH